MKVKELNHRAVIQSAVIATEQGDQTGGEINFGQFINVSMCENFCNGEEDNKEKCGDCHGEGRIKSESTIKVSVPGPEYRKENYIL